MLPENRFHHRSQHVHNAHLDILIQAPAPSGNALYNGIREQFVHDETASDCGIKTEKEDPRHRCRPGRAFASGSDPAKALRDEALSWVSVSTDDLVNYSHLPLWSCVDEYLMFKTALAGEHHCDICFIAGFNPFEVSQ